MTGRDLITASLRIIGAIAPGESITASEAVDGLATLNRMIDSWSNEGLLINSKTRETFSLTAGVSAYTMGVGGAFNTARPQRIEQAFVRSSIINPALEYPLRVLNFVEWGSIFQKETNATLPTDLYVEETNPLNVLNIYPIPSAGYQIVIYSWKPLNNLSTIDSDVSFAPGYEEALIYNFAIRLAPEYGRQIGQEVMMIATESKASIKRMNHNPRYLKSDEALLNDGQFNVYTGGYR